MSSPARQALRSPRQTPRPAGRRAWQGAALGRAACVRTLAACCASAVRRGGGRRASSLNASDARRRLALDGRFLRSESASRRLFLAAFGGLGLPRHTPCLPRRSVSAKTGLALFHALAAVRLRHVPAWPLTPLLCLAASPERSRRAFRRLGQAPRANTDSAPNSGASRK